MANLTKIPQVQSNDRVINQLQQNIITRMNTLLANPMVSGNLLSATLDSGDNTINHLLGRDLQGWIVVLQNAAATIYDKQDSNTTPNITLILNSSASVTVTLYVF